MFVQKFFPLFFLCFLLFGLAGRGRVVLAQTADAVSPAENLRCWTQSTCEQNIGGVIQGRWDNESRAAKTECPGYGYCFNIPEDISLAIAIPGTNKQVAVVRDVGEYLGVFYKFLLGFAIVVVTVIVMVRGVQFILASGSSAQVSKITQGIFETLSGLVLLFFAVLILLTINPQLISLKIPTLPKIREIVFLSKDSSCQYLRQAGYEIEMAPGSTGKCGDEKGKIKADPNGVPLSEEKTCRWTDCKGQKDAAGFTKICTEVRGQDQCLSCMDVIADNDLGITPSGAVCAGLTPGIEEGVDDDAYVDCQFSRDQTATAMGINGQCALVAIDCKQIKKCEKYDKISVRNNEWTQPLDSFEGPSALADDFSPITNICEGNICEAKVPGVVSDGPCRLYEGTFVVECVSASDPCLNSLTGC